MENWRESLDPLLDKLPFLIALLAWLVSVAVRNARRGSAGGGRRPPLAPASRGHAPSTGAEAPAGDAGKGYRPIEPR